MAATIRFDIGDTGTENQSRSDAALSGAVSVVNVNPGSTNTLELLSRPVGSAASVGGATPTFSITPDVVGSYRLKLTADAGDSVIHTLTVKTAVLGLHIPAHNEQASEDATIADTAYVAESETNEGADAETQQKGWAKPMEENLLSVEADALSNQTHRTGDGSDHADVASNTTAIALNTTHRSSDGSDHSDVVTNSTHVAGDGSDHADVAANTAHRGLTNNPHATDIENLGAGTLAELNAAISDANVDDDGDSRPPLNHASDHTDGTDDIQDAESPATKGLATGAQIAAIEANTAKVTNATHSGDVTGATALTIGADKVNDTHIDFGTGANQVSTADVPEQTNLYYTEARVSANTDVSTNSAKVTNANHSGDATGSTALTIADDAVTYAKMQNVVADDVILGNVDGAGGIVNELTATEVRTLINVEDGSEANNISDANATDLTDGGATTLHSHAGGGSSPLTTKGDLYTYTSVDARLPIGTNAYVLTADSAEATGMKWAAATGGSSPLTTKGDLHVYTTTDARLAVGTNDYVLTADSTEASGVKWAAGGGGGGVSGPTIATLTDTCSFSGNDISLATEDPEDYFEVGQSITISGSSTTSELDTVTFANSSITFATSGKASSFSVGEFIKVTGSLYNDSYGRVTTATAIASIVSNTLNFSGTRWYPSTDDPNVEVATDNNNGPVHITGFSGTPSDTIECDYCTFVTETSTASVTIHNGPIKKEFVAYEGDAGSDIIKTRAGEVGFAVTGGGVVGTSLAVWGLNASPTMGLDYYVESNVLRVKEGGKYSANWSMWLGPYGSITALVSVYGILQNDLTGSWIDELVSVGYAVLDATVQNNVIRGSATVNLKPGGGLRIRGYKNAGDTSQVVVYTGNAGGLTLQKLPG